MKRVVGEGGVDERRWSHTCAESKTNLLASQTSLKDRVREKPEREIKEEEREKKKGELLNVRDESPWHLDQDGGQRTISKARDDSRSERRDC